MANSINACKILQFACTNDTEYRDKFYKQFAKPVLVTKDKQLGRIIINQRGLIGLDGPMSEYRVLTGDTTNMWINIDNADHVIDDNFVVIINKLVITNNHKRINIGNNVAITPISNVIFYNGYRFPHWWFNRRNYNHDSRIENIDQCIQRCVDCIVEGVTNIPHVFDDGIAIPMFDQYKSSSEYYLTVFHEIAHYVRFRVIGIDQNAINDDMIYKQEEIIAELTAQRLADHFQLNYDRKNSMAYVAEYVKMGFRDFDQTSTMYYLNRLVLDSELTARQIINMME